jgi:hypothetical protein
MITLHWLDLRSLGSGRDAIPHRPRFYGLWGSVADRWTERAFAPQVKPACVSDSRGGVIFADHTSMIPSVQCAKEDREALACTRKPRSASGFILERDDFQFSDLSRLSDDLVFRYRAKSIEMWKGFDNSLANSGKNAAIYVGHFSTFGVAWVVLFRLAALSTWAHANRAHFGSVAVILGIFVVVSLLRLSRTLASVPILQMVFVSMMIRADPEMASPLDVSEERRSTIRSRLDNLTTEQMRRDINRSSLSGFVLSLLQIPKIETKTKGRPPDIYRRGERFAFSDPANRFESLDNYAAFAYYRLHNRLSVFARGFWQFVSLKVTGVP